MAPEYFFYTVLHHFSRRTTFGKMISRRIWTYFPEIWKFRYMDFGILICSTIMEFDLKWVHMARYGLILKQDGAVWFRIILKPLLAPKTATMDPTIQKKVSKSAPNQPSYTREVSAYLDGSRRSRFASRRTVYARKSVTSRSRDATQSSTMTSL